MKTDLKIETEKEIKLLEGYRELICESQDFIDSTIAATLIGQKAAIKEASRTKNSLKGA